MCVVQFADTRTYATHAARTRYAQDPAQQLQAFVTAQRQRMASISLGQGQEKRAVAAIDYAHDSGTWVLLQVTNICGR